MRMPPFQIVRTVTAPNGKHYRVAAWTVPCGTPKCDVRYQGPHLHLRARMLDPLPITYRGMVTWPTRRRRSRR